MVRRNPSSAGSHCPLSAQGLGQTQRLQFQALKVRRLLVGAGSLQALEARGLLLLWLGTQIIVAPGTQVGGSGLYLPVTPAPGR
jgi:hypothetical protein